MTDSHDYTLKGIQKKFADDADEYIKMTEEHVKRFIIGGQPVPSSLIEPYNLSYAFSIMAQEIESMKNIIEKLGEK